MRPQTFHHFKKRLSQVGNGVKTTQRVFLKLFIASFTGEKAVKLEKMPHKARVIYVLKVVPNIQR